MKIYQYVFDQGSDKDNPRATILIAATDGKHARKELTAHLELMGYTKKEAKEASLLVTRNIGAPSYLVWSEMEGKNC